MDLVLGGSFIGAVAAIIALFSGQSIWIALLIYSGIGILAVLTFAVVIFLRAIFVSQSYNGTPGPIWRTTFAMGNIG